MKKLLSLLLVMCLCLSFAACKSEKVDKNHDEESSSALATDTDKDNEELNAKDDKEDVVETVTKEETTQENADKNQKPSKEENKPEVKPEAKPEVKPSEKEEVKPQEKPQEAKTMGTSIANDFKSKYQNYTTSFDLANALCQNPKLEFGPVAMEIEEGFLTGFDNSEITGFKDGAMFAPMIGTIPFVGYVFTMQDGADINAFKQNLKAKANMRWNICTEADEMICISQGNKVLFVMCKNAEE